jgi:aspartyl-tRNA(Asn)/glutamyl-tRNA(Gln) amidotransferase subunit B
MRSKEEANDYRYFPDPDLPVLVVDGPTMGGVIKSQPELPAARFKRYLEDVGLSADDARTLIGERPLADYFDAACKAHGMLKSGRTIANWILTELLGALNKAGKGIADSPMPPERLAALVRLVEAGTISGKIGKEVFEESFAKGDEPGTIVEKRGLQQISDEAALTAVIDEVIAASPKQTAEYQGGKDTLFGYFVGQVMKKTQGRANPVITTDLLKKRLGR